jgi:uncharacterized membrane protein YsdA (DUF1294 family)/cold shock CspA family protein
VQPDSGRQKIFIHISDFNNSHRRPEQSLAVSYIATTDDSGRAKGKSILFKGEKRTPNIKKPGLFSIAMLVIFTAFALVSVVFHTLPRLVLAFYLLICVITFIAYAIDKSAAIKGRWRTKESTLHLLALIGGWPGALLAQQKLHHKSSKQAFLFVFWITVVINLGGFVWLHTSAGSTFLSNYVHNADVKFLNLISDISLPDFVQIWLWKIDYYLNK